MNFPKISIIVPSYNQGRYLDETLVSIVNQQYQNLELLVADGGSTDNSVDVIKKYESKINWWVSEKDKGQSDAINKGFGRATGEIITWINSDDLLLPGSLHKVAAYFSQLPGTTGLIHGGMILFDEKKDLETRFEYLSPSAESYLSGMVFSQPSAFFRKKYLHEVGFLNGDLHFGMDYDLFMRLALVCTFQPVKDVFSKYRLHDQSKSVAESNRFINDWKKSFVNLCKNLSWNTELEFLKDTGLYTEHLGYHQKFSFVPDPSFVLSLSSQKALFLHLGHVLKDLYWTGEMGEAKQLMKMIQKKFPEGWANEDTRLRAVMTKLKLPGFAISLLKKIRQVFK